MTVKEIYQSIIQTGNYVCAELEAKIEKSWAWGKLTDEERVDLLDSMYNNANDTMQIDVATILADLEQRVSALESKGVVVWVYGMVTAKGQTVLYDIDSDGVLDYVRYDGGRASTSSRPGNIEGWVKTDANGTVTHTISKDGNGNIVLTPVED